MESIWLKSAEHYRSHDHAVTAAFTEPKIKTVCDIAGPSKGRKPLEIGTGTGAFLISF